MKKKIFIILLGLFIIGAGFFVYVKFFKLDSLENRYIESSPREDYVVQEVDGKTFVNNEKAGISFFVPEGWEIREEFDDLISLYSEGAIKNEKKIGFLEQGCRVFIEAKEIRTNINSIREYLEDNHYSASEYYIINEFNEGSIDNRKFIKHTHELIKLNNRFEDYFIAGKKNVYSVLVTINNNSDFCREGINQIINDIRLK